MIPMKPQFTSTTFIMIVHKSLLTTTLSHQHRDNSWELLLNMSSQVLFIICTEM
uniref:Uncharacterized protein n=1 Tax=Rhizophora mucronata TaxID=61149 RepID=A0A2P2PRR8_RHIMU